MEKTNKYDPDKEWELYIARRQARESKFSARIKRMTMRYIAPVVLKIMYVILGITGIVGTVALVLLTVYFAKPLIFAIGLFFGFGLFMLGEGDDSPLLRIIGILLLLIPGYFLAGPIIAFFTGVWTMTKIIIVVFASCFIVLFLTATGQM